MPANLTRNLPVQNDGIDLLQPPNGPTETSYSGNVGLQTRVVPRVEIGERSQGSLKQVGKSEVKVDAMKLVQGKAAFTDDLKSGVYCMQKY